MSFRFFDFQSRYSAYHHSHPTLTERLKGLETFQAKQRGEWAGRDKKDL